VTNLATFAEGAPPYMKNEIVGSAVVPCYAGWYFTVILGNGSVLPCCQCTEPVDTISPERGLAQIWASGRYGEFRDAARSLPAPSPRLATCECDSCQLRPRNLAIHNFLHPLARLESGRDIKRFRPADVVRKMLGRHGYLS